MILSAETGGTPVLVWFKSTYSGGEPGSDCVEVAWSKSTHSDGGPDSDCVEVGSSPVCSLVHVRDSKSVQRGMLNLPPAAWSAFVDHVAGR